MSENRITVIGIGDDGAESLSATALGRVDQAQVLCGGERQLRFFPDHPGQRLTIRTEIAELAGELDRLRQVQRVVVLASGDPLFYGIGASLVTYLGEQAVEIVPNVSSIQLAFARLGLAWQDATLLSAHGRPLTSVLAPALRQSKVALLTDPINTPAAIARALLDAGSDDCSAWVLEHLGGPEERVVAGRLSDLRERAFAPLNLLVLRREQPLSRARLGLPDDAYSHSRGLITKREVRVVTIAQLALNPTSIVWDVGAGSGSIAIEAATLLESGQVYAVERDARQLEQLQLNRRHFHAGNVHIVDGDAPDALAELPAPDAVFVGGSGGRLRRILEGVAARLRPEGRLVVNAATLETLEETRHFSQEQGWRLELVDVAISRGVAIGDALRREAQNPVFVLTLDRGADR